jgi:hypothetical protein
MPRFRALFLLALFILNQVACTSWQVPKVSPQEYVTKHPDKKVRVTATDVPGNNKAKARVVLRGVRFAGDSVFGQDKNGQPLAFSLQQMARLEVRRVDGERTLGLILLLVPLTLVGLALVACAIDCTIAP